MTKSGNTTQNSGSATTFVYKHSQFERKRSKTCLKSEKARYRVKSLSLTFEGLPDSPKATQKFIMAFLTRKCAKPDARNERLKRANWDQTWILTDVEEMCIHTWELLNFTKANHPERKEPKAKEKVSPRVPVGLRNKNRFLQAQIDHIKDRKIAQSEEKLNKVVRQDRKRDLWIEVNRVRRRLFRQTFDHKAFQGYSRMELFNPWMSKIQKIQAVDIFKAYRKKVYYTLVRHN